MKKKIHPIKRAFNTMLIALFLLSMVSCTGNKGKLKGKWKVISALVLGPDFYEVSDRIEELKKINPGHSDEKLEALRDSVSAKLDKEGKYYESGTYHFNDDGKVNIKFDDREINGNWELLESENHLRLIIQENGNTLQQWQLSAESFHTPKFESDKEFWADMNIGGGSFSNNPKERYFVKLILKMVN